MAEGAVPPTVKASRGVGPIHHTVLNVADLDRSIYFYGEMLDLHKTLESTVGGPSFEQLLRLPTGTSARICYFDGGVHLGQIELVQWSLSTTDPDSTQPEGPVATDLRRSIISFQLERDELRQLHAQLTEADVVCWSEPTAIDLPSYGSILAFIAEDPDGHPIEFVALPSADEATAAHRAARGE
jgi:catechol 2,3-dioxygenase-like lactoylglutathione lyase family enzyme